MVAEVNIEIGDGQTHFLVGDRITGTAEVTIDEELSITESVVVSYLCTGEVRWTEGGTNNNVIGTVQGESVTLKKDNKQHIYHQEEVYHEESLQFSETGIPVVRQIENTQTFMLPFTFIIPKSKELPSSFVSTRGAIRHCIQVMIREPGQESAFTKEVTVQAPVENNLTVSVGGSAEKAVLYHSGTVTLQASIDRKGFAPGQTAMVHVSVDNRANTAVVPRVALQQVQIYMADGRHRTVETTVAERLFTDQAVGPISQTDLSLELRIPVNEWLTNRCSLLSVKYFVVVALVVPHSLQLHLSLPVVLTTEAVITRELEAKQLKEKLKPPCSDL